MNKYVLAPLALALAGALVSCAPTTEAVENPASNRLQASDLPYEWVLNYNQDMQYPELPTGCEATALSTLMRMNGYLVSKTEVADAMPKSDGEDFVTAFWGDPYSKHGWACMAPCSVNTANSFFEICEEYAAVDLTGVELADAPVPFVAWVTIDMEDPIPSEYEQSGYRLMHNPHCVTVVRVSDEYVTCVDPLKGYAEYPRGQFEAVFDAMGKQAVYINELNEALRVERELRGER